MSSDEIELTIKELIRLSLTYRESAGFGSKLPTTAIQKVLYELRRKLPEDHLIRARLPYYWFKAGPYSEYVDRSLEGMSKDGILYVEKKSNYVLFTLNKDYTGRRLHEHDENFVQARKLLQSIVSNLQPFSIYQEIKSQYEDDAPSLFYPRYKLEFLPNIEMYFKMLKEPERRTRNFQPENQKDCMSKLLSISTSSLPFNSVFSDFKKVYFDFEIAFGRLLKMNYKRNLNKYVQLLEEGVQLSLNVWDAFAYGARIIKHDSIYDSEVERWEKKFNDETEKLSRKVEQFYKMILDEVKGNLSEKYLPLSEFHELLIKAKKNNEISFINFSKAPNMEAIPYDIVEKIKKIPEFSIYLTNGFLDYSVISGLTEDELGTMIKENISQSPIYVAFSKKGEMTKTMTYRVYSNSLSSEEPIEVPS